MKQSELVKGLYEVDLGLTLLFWEVYGGDEFYPLREKSRGQGTVPAYNVERIIE